MPSDRDIIEYAIRYCITRKSYAFEDGLDLAERHWPILAESTVRDVLYAIRRNDTPVTARWPRISAALYPQEQSGGET